MPQINADQPKKYPWESAASASSAKPSCPVFDALGLIFSKVSRLQESHPVFVVVLLLRIPFFPRVPRSL
jgi:hypothetical protein